MIDIKEARLLAEDRFNSGWRPQRLLGAENVKLKKAEKMNWRGLGLSLAPSDHSGYEVCASRSPQCAKHCIFTSGRGVFPKTMVGRILRTIWFFRDRAGFIDRLYHEIDRNRDAAIRLNVFSDLMWERQFPDLFATFPQVQFYDYTKHFNRMFRARPDNYHLTFSLTESNAAQARQVLAAGSNVAAVLKNLNGTLFGFPIIDGDEHDLRFLDPVGVVVGLHPKGSLKKHPGAGMVYVPDRTLTSLEAA